VAKGSKSRILKYRLKKTTATSEATRGRGAAGDDPWEDSRPEWPEDVRELQRPCREESDPDGHEYGCPSTTPLSLHRCAGRCRRRRRAGHTLRRHNQESRSTPTTGGQGSDDRARLLGGRRRSLRLGLRCGGLAFDVLARADDADYRPRG
jgi:hypothetical protein